MVAFADVWHALVMAMFAATAAAGATVAIERLGGIIGGVISSAPTTIVPTAVGLALATSIENVQHAMWAVPVGMLVNVLVLYTWRQLPPYLPHGFTFPQKLATMVASSLAIWFVAVLFLVIIVRDQLGFSIELLGILCAAVTVVFGWAAVFLQKIPAPKGTNKVAIPTLLARGLLAGCAVFTAGLLGKVNAYAAGFASMFPAIFTTTMVSMWLSQGENVGTGAAGPMMLGSQSVTAFGAMYAILLPHASILVTTVVSWLFGICCFSIPNALILRWLVARQAAQAGVEPAKPTLTQASSDVTLVVAADDGVEISSAKEPAEGDDDLPRTHNDEVPLELVET